MGEAPGADELRAAALPFVGKAGQLLDRMIAAMGLRPDDVYVCNIIKCRPPGNRRPTAEETTSCIPYLHEQLANVSPKVIVAMGNTSAQALLDTKLGITRLRGEWKLDRGGKTLLMPTYHPSYLCARARSRALEAGGGGPPDGDEGARAPAPSEGDKSARLSAAAERVRANPERGFSAFDEEESVAIGPSPSRSKRRGGRRGASPRLSTQTAPSAPA